MQCSEEQLVNGIGGAIVDAKFRSNGNKFQQGVRHGYVKALEQVHFAMTVQQDKGGMAHLEKGVDA